MERLFQNLHQITKGIVQEEDVEGDVNEEVLRIFMKKFGE